MLISISSSMLRRRAKFPPKVCLVWSNFSLFWASRRAGETRSAFVKKKCTFHDSHIDKLFFARTRALQASLEAAFALLVLKGLPRGLKAWGKSRV